MKRILYLSLLINIAVFILFVYKRYVRTEPGKAKAPYSLGKPYLSKVKRQGTNVQLSPNWNLIEISGQSNAVGIDTVVNFLGDVNVGVPGIFIYNATSGKIEPLKAGKNNSGTPDNDRFVGHFGVEMRLMELLKSGSKDDQYLIKYGKQGVQLAASRDLTDWSPSSRGEFFDDSNERHFKALKALKDNRPPMAYIWIQGENDASLNNAGRYQENLKGFILEKRRTYGYLNMPFIIVRLGKLQYGLDSSKYVNQVRRAQETTAERLPAVHLVDADGLPTFDGVHYTGHSYNLLAERIHKVLENIKDKKAGN